MSIFPQQVLVVGVQFDVAVLHVVVEGLRDGPVDATQFGVGWCVISLGLGEPS